MSVVVNAIFLVLTHSWSVGLANQVQMLKRVSVCLESEGVTAESILPPRVHFGQVEAVMKPLQLKVLEMTSAHG